MQAYHKNKKYCSWKCWYQGNKDHRRQYMKWKYYEKRDFNLIEKELNEIDLKEGWELST